jgi:hypothetical protein
VQVSSGHPPSGVVTFLFTDVEGSTRRWEADADGMRAALAAHDEVFAPGDRAARGLAETFAEVPDGGTPPTYSGCLPTGSTSADRLRSY